MFKMYFLRLRSLQNLFRLTVHFFQHQYFIVNEFVSTAKFFSLNKEVRVFFCRNQQIHTSGIKSNRVTCHCSDLVHLLKCTQLEVFNCTCFVKSSMRCDNSFNQLIILLYALFTSVRAAHDSYCDTIQLFKSFSFEITSMFMYL